MVEKIDIEKIDIEKIENAVKEFNRIALLKESEKIVDTVFSESNKSESNKKVYSSIQKFILIDLLWNANAFRFTKIEPEANNRFETICDLLKKVDKDIEGLKSKDLNSENLAEKFKWISTDDARVTNGVQRRSVYSALSKYLHWTKPDIFPIYDNYAVDTIYKESVKDCHPKKFKKSELENDYGSLIKYYYMLLEQYNDNEKTILRNWAGNNEKLSGYELENKSILRVLDKYFYMQGKDEAEKKEKQKKKHVGKNIS